MSQSSPTNGENFEKMYKAFLKAEADLRFNQVQVWSHDSSDLGSQDSSCLNLSQRAYHVLSFIRRDCRKAQEAQSSRSQGGDDDD